MTGLVVLLGVIVLVAGGVVGVDYLARSHTQTGRVVGLSVAAPQPAYVSAPLGGRTAATLDVLAATSRVRVKIGDIGDRLYRISTPAGTGNAPSATLTADTINLSANKDGEVDVELAATVRWTLRFAGYADDQQVDLTGGSVADVAIVGSSHSMTLSLPAASGSVPLSVTGAIADLTVRTPAGSPVRVHIGATVTKAVAGTRTITNLAPGSTLTPKDEPMDNSYDLTTLAPVATLTIQTAQ